MNPVSVGLIERSIPSQHFQARVAACRLRCLGYAKAVEKSFNSETVHKLRTHLRRLQSYAEFIEDQRSAECLAEAVSWFSRLRSLDELRRYLCKTDAPTKDVRRVEKALQKEQEKVKKSERPNDVILLASSITPKCLTRPESYLMARLHRLQLENRTALGEALQKLPSNPKRKELHCLRLLIKSLRYQQEIAVEMQSGNPKTVQALKRLQGVLGDYSDRAQFARMAKELKLTVRDEIKKDRRRSRKCACRAIRKLTSKHVQPVLPFRRARVGPAVA
jgi:CHAD domain-containing protein